MERWRDVAEVLKPLAKARRGIQMQLASRWGLSEGLISRYINGETVPDPLLAARLCAELGADLNKLAGLDEQPPGDEVKKARAEAERKLAEAQEALARLTALERRKP